MKQLYIFIVLIVKIYCSATYLVSLICCSPFLDRYNIPYENI